MKPTTPYLTWKYLITFRNPFLDVCILSASSKSESTCESDEHWGNEKSFCKHVFAMHIFNFFYAFHTFFALYYRHHKCMNLLTKTWLNSMEMNYNQQTLKGFNFESVLWSTPRTRLENNVTIIARTLQMSDQQDCAVRWALAFEQCVPILDSLWCVGHVCWFSTLWFQRFIFWFSSFPFSHLTWFVVI